jgi:hypothetical protein
MAHNESFRSANGAIPGDTTRQGNTFNAANKLVKLDASAKLPAVGLAAAATFVSVEQTGTGNAQNVAHTLGSVPSVVFVQVTDSGAIGYTVVEGTHTNTNLIVTVTLGAKFVAKALK